MVSIGKPTTQLLDEAKEDLSEIIEYVAAETADVSLLLWLQELELKFNTIYRRLSNPVAPHYNSERGRLI